MSNDEKQPDLTPGMFYLHTPSGTVGELSGISPAGTYTSKVNGELVDYDVAVFVDGNDFLAKRENFVALTDGEVALFRLTADTVAATLRDLARYSASQRLPADRAIPVFVSVLRATASALTRHTA
jgi:hypothetical protein